MAVSDPETKHAARPHLGWILGLTSTAYFMVVLDSVVVVTAPSFHRLLHPVVPRSQVLIPERAKTGRPVSRRGGISTRSGQRTAAGTGHRKEKDNGRPRTRRPS